MPTPLIVPPLRAGDRVFVTDMAQLCTVLDVYGDGSFGYQGDVRLDLCGNTPIKNLEHYDAARHSQHLGLFIPVKEAWKETYGVTQDIPTREALQALVDDQERAYTSGKGLAFWKATALLDEYRKKHQLV